jgi:hypothetical protein
MHSHYTPTTSVPESSILVVSASKSLVLFRAHEVLKILDALLVDSNLADPAATVRVVFRDSIDLSGLLLEHQINIGDAARNWRIDISGALDGLDGADRIAGLNRFVGLGEFYIDDIAQLFSGVRGDTNDTGGFVGIEVDPFVVLGVLANLSCKCIVSDREASRKGPTRMLLLDESAHGFCKGILGGYRPHTGGGHRECADRGRLPIAASDGCLNESRESRGPSCPQASCD